MKEVFSFVFGSRVYGTATKDSDTDIYVVVDELDDAMPVENGEILVTKNNTDTHYVSIETFGQMLKDCQINALEALWTDKSFFTNKEAFDDFAAKNFKLDLQKVRTTISSMSINHPRTKDSWV